MIDAIASEFARYRSLSEGAAGQLEWAHLRVSLDPEVNSIAVVMKHVAGNLRSRWTEPFTSDGEKEWRDRDKEFVDTFASREELEAMWGSGWGALSETLDRITDADLSRSVRIRGELHTLARALARSLSHTSYHCGQIVQAARAIANREGISWSVLSVPRGGSRALNASMGYEPSEGTKGSSF